MRLPLLGALCLACPTAAAAQAGSVIGQVVLRGTGEVVAHATVTVVGSNHSALANDRGQFSLGELPGGEVRLRVRRIGYSPGDTTIVLRASEQIRIRIELTRLAIQLPEVLVSGVCTDRTPFEPRPAALTELFDQVLQNAERLRIVAQVKPFRSTFEMRRSRGDRANNLVLIGVDTSVVGALPARPYVPRRVVWTDQRGQVFIMLPQLADFADTSFTNNHCFHYAGQTRLGADSVIQVDFEPVPWLDRQLDLKGSLYLRVGTYELVETLTRLNRIARPVRGLQDYNVRAQFREFAPGLSTLFSWELTNWVTSKQRGYVEHGRLLSITFADSRMVRVDTIRLR